MAGKKKQTSTKESYEIEGNPWSLTDSPWGTEADYANQLTGDPINLCRDYVILRYLMEGDTRPLAALFSLGYSPSSVVLDYLAGMLQPADGTETEIEYVLRPKRRNGKPGPLPNPESKWVGTLAALNVRELMKNGSKYEHEAIPTVAEMLPSGMKAYETVRAEYDKTESSST